MKSHQFRQYLFPCQSTCNAFWPECRRRYVGRPTQAIFTLTLEPIFLRDAQRQRRFSMDFRNSRKSDGQDNNRRAFPNHGSQRSSQRFDSSGLLTWHEPENTRDQDIYHCWCDGADQEGPFWRQSVFSSRLGIWQDCSYVRRPSKQARRRLHLNANTSLFPRSPHP